MACPFFEPQDLTEDAIFTRLPLGQAYTGRCHGGEASEQLPLKICNQGYARGRCERFPTSFAVDAYRFAKTSDGGIVWIEEAGHAPLSFGPATRIPAENMPARQQLKAFQRSVLEGKIR